MKLLPLGSNSPPKIPAKNPLKYTFLNELNVFVRMILFGTLLALFIENNCAYFLGANKKFFFNILLKTKPFFFKAARLCLRGETR